MTAIEDLRIVLFMPSYNHEPYVEAAVNSMLAQVWDIDSPHPVTVAVVDDESSDRTFEIVQDLAASYRGPFKIYLERREKEKDVYHINSLTARVPGDVYIIFCSDDLFDPMRMTKTVQAFVERDASAVTCNARLISETGEDMGLRKAYGGSRPLETAEDFSRFGALTTFFGAGMAFHRRVFDLFEPIPNIIRNVDNLIPFRAMLLGPNNGNVFLDEPLLQWRRHAGQHTLRVQRDYVDDELEKLRYQERMHSNKAANFVAMMEDVATLRHNNRAPPDLKINNVELATGRHLRKTVRQWMEVRRRLLTEHGIGIA